MTTTNTGMSIRRITDQQLQFAKSLYEEKLRFELETEENIGKMVIIDTNTGEYEVGDQSGITIATKMQTARGGNAPLFAIRIGYDAADALGGFIQRIPR